MAKFIGCLYLLIIDKWQLYLGGGGVGLFPDMGGQNPCFVKSNFLLFLHEILHKLAEVVGGTQPGVELCGVAADAGDGGDLIDFLGKL